MAEQTYTNTRNIEVERKFMFSVDTLKTLEQYSTGLSCKIKFTDIYWDTRSHDLMLSDYWLRQRESVWELKMPVIESDTHVFSSQYQEVTYEQDIVAHICNLFKRKNVDLIFKDINSLHSELVQVACMETERCTYEVDGSFTVVLDKADFGYKVAYINLITL